MVFHGLRLIISSTLNFLPGLLFLMGAYAQTAEYYVSNTAGSDSNSGDIDKPFGTIAHALSILKSGDTLHLIATQQPYCEKVTIGKGLAGTQNQPTIIDGHGAIIDGRRRLRSAEWTDEGDGVFSRKLLNNAWQMDRQGYWSGDFPLVTFDGLSGRNCQKRSDLTPSAYFLQKLPPTPKDKQTQQYHEQHNRLFIKLLPGSSPDDVNVVTLDSAGILVMADHVTVRNVKICYVPIDCFSTFWSKNVVLHNIEGSYAMDQGISNHSSVVNVSNSSFHHNAGCGIVDIVMSDASPCVVTYKNCQVKDNFYRGGIEFSGKNGSYAMEDCVITNNAKTALLVDKGASVNIRNCIFFGRDQSAVNGISVRQGGALDMRFSTVCQFRDAFVWQTDASLTLTENAIVACRVAYRAPFGEQFDSNNNYFADVKFALSSQNLVTFLQYRDAVKYDHGSIFEERYPELLPPLRIKAQNEQRYGAILEQFAK